MPGDGDADDSCSEARAPPLPSLVHGRWAIHPRIGSGSYSEVHLGIDKETREQVAVKFEWIYAEKSGKLLQEAELYKSLPEEGHVPCIRWSGTEGEYNILVMELLGPSLEDLLDAGTGNFGLKTVIMIALQILDRVEYVHKCGIIHRDIKAENFLIGKGDKQDRVYLVDFGLAKKYLCQDGSHVACAQKHSLTGTARYVSLNVHQGLEPSRRDDVGSVGYLLVYLFLGELPWQGIGGKSKKVRRKQIQIRKEQTSHRDLCKGMPEQFVAYLRACDSLKFEDTPDYCHLKQLMQCALKGCDFTLDWKFDWTLAEQQLKRPKCLNDWGQKKRTVADPTENYVSAEGPSTKRRRIMPSQDHDNDDGDDTGPTFHWKVSADEIRVASKGDQLESPVFNLKGVASKLRLRYYPKGHKRAAKTSCSAYVWSENAVTMQLKVWVNNRSKVIDKEGPVPWRSGKDRGYPDFCVAPEEDVALKIQVLQGSQNREDSSESIDAVSSEGYEYYSTLSEDAESETSDTDEECEDCSD
eukprot:TRINITY_DN26572_c0_g1_i1.p1 TRINITY_DN26572_c0_g1~~TRINITY_DN26572_c0_g1_i1.p1  ORF type:complete len:536 (-),score=78.99 TRINITY_DN26572_c0_g1_i1:20-1594(-)